MEREIREVKTQLDRLREDALYLRSLVKSQDSLVSLLQYLQQAPFFKSEGQQLTLDGAGVLRQISGTNEVEGEAKQTSEPKTKDIGGVCLNIKVSYLTSL